MRITEQTLYLPLISSFPLLSGKRSEKGADSTGDDDLYEMVLRSQVSIELVTITEVSGLLLYRKIPIISPGHIFVQNTFLLGLFSEGELLEGSLCF